MVGGFRRDVSAVRTPFPPLGVRGRLGQVTDYLLFAPCALHQCMPDFKPHGFKFTAQLMIPETQHLDALFCEEAVSFFIFGALVWKATSTAIEFDSQHCDRAVEIQEVDAACVLATEFELKL